MYTINTNAISETEKDSNGKESQGSRVQLKKTVIKNNQTTMNCTVRTKVPRRNNFVPRGSKHIIVPYGPIVHL